MRVTVTLGGRRVVCRIPIQQDALFARKTLLMLRTTLPTSDPDLEAPPDDLDEDVEVEIRKQMRELLVRVAVLPKCINEVRDDEPTDVVNLAEVSDADVVNAWNAVTGASGLSKEAADEIAPLSQAAPSS